MVVEKIILGVDPGTTVMGFGIIEVVKNQMRFVQMNELLLSKYDNHYLKLKHIFERTTELIDTYHPDELAKECAIHAQARTCPRSGYGGGIGTGLTHYRIRT